MGIVQELYTQVAELNKAECNSEAIFVSHPIFRHNAIPDVSKCDSIISVTSAPEYRATFLGFLVPQSKY